MAYSLYLIRNTRDTDLYYAEHGEIGGVPDAVGYSSGNVSNKHMGYAHIFA